MSDHDFTRRDFLKASGIGAALLAMPGCVTSGGHAGAAPARKPNIIFMMGDDMGYGDLGCYGQKVIKTPHIDQIAAEGLRFTNVYTGATVCAPSRSVLMTGLHAGHTRVRGNKAKVSTEDTDDGRVPFRPEDFTVAELLKQAGYATGITGKWGLGEPGSTGVPNKQGFDEWFGYLNQAHAHSYYPDYLWKNEERMEIPGNKDGKQQTYSHDLFAEFALDFIKRHKEEPFFLYLAWTIPHAQFQVPSLEPYTNEDLPDDAKRFAAMMTRLDRDTGRIMALLKELNIDDNTIVFFCSDNGTEKGWEGVFDSGGDLRGCKATVYEGGIRTPMIVRWPGKIQAGQVDNNSVWYFADILPTFGALAGVEPPPGLDGVNVLPALLGEKQELSDRYLYWESFEGEFKQAVRWKNWKAIRLKQGQPLELYNLKEDPQEKQDVASRHPDVVARFEAYLKTARTESPNWPV